jgi:murein DD-endopeptidase MepM/ murein hydrolase activator NlpD
MKRFIGNRGYYTVRQWDTLKRVGARLGVDWRSLVKINNLDPKAQLRPGQIIAYDNRKIVPSALRDGIVINIADRTLYLLKNGEVRTKTGPPLPAVLSSPPRKRTLSGESPSRSRMRWKSAASSRSRRCRRARTTLSGNMP